MSYDYYPDNPVSVYTALRDALGLGMSVHLGVFSDEERARTVCQDDADNLSESLGVPGRVLTWTDDRAELPDGIVYTVILTTLDVPTGQG